MNVKQLQEILKVNITHGSMLGLPVVDLTEVEVETRDLPISLPKTTWNLMDGFDIVTLKTEASMIRLFEETIISCLFSSPHAILAMTLKGEPND